MYCDAWTSVDRLYGVAERLILVLGVVVEGWRSRRAEGRRSGPPKACWERELEPGAELEGSTEGHNTLFSLLNPSVTCHTLVMDGKRKTVEKREEEVKRKKEQLDVLGYVDFFFL